MILDRVVSWLLPRENRFFTYLESIAKQVTVAADAFSEIRKAEGHAAYKQVAERMRRIEHETDQIAHLLYEELDKTFVTPLDREDLHALTSRLDEIVDIFESCAAHIAIYRLEKLTPPMLELVRITQEAAHEVSRCISLLQDLSKVDEIQVHLVHVNTLENEGDKIYRKALEDLFLTVKDPIELIREKEVLQRLENSIDACEDVMDLVRSVVVKNG
jgi:predicted phosphate transport protein (TIGR00153 family)